MAAILSDQMGKPLVVGQIWPARDQPEYAAAIDDEPDPLMPSPDTHIDCPFHGIGEHSVLCGSAPGSAATTGPALVPLAVDWLAGASRQAPTSARGDDLAVEVVDLLSAQVGALDRLGDAQGDGVVLDWATHQLSWAWHLINHTAFGPAIGRRLYRAVAELSRLAGWLAIDQGKQSLGRRHLATGLQASMIAGDRPLGAYILSCLSYNLLWEGNGRDAVRLIKLARLGLDESGPGMVRALLASREARAHAQLGDENECLRALADAARLAADASKDTTPSWAHWIDAGVLLGDEGRAQLDLGHPLPAEGHLVTALHKLDDGQLQNRKLHMLSVAEARLDLSDLDGARQAIRDALDLADGPGSCRTRSRLAALHGHVRTFDARAARDALCDIEDMLNQQRLSA